MDKKIKIAFIKQGGLISGGTEKFLQAIAANLPKDRFDVDYYYSDPAPFKGQETKPIAITDMHRVKYMQDNGVNLVKFNIESIMVRQINIQQMLIKN